MASTDKVVGSTQLGRDGGPAEDRVEAILQSSLPNPLGGNLLLSAGEKVKLVEDALIVMTEKIGSEGQFILTNERIAFRMNGLVTSKLLTSIDGVVVQSNLLFVGRFWEVLKVSYGPSTKDLIIFPNLTSDDLIETIAIVIQDLRTQAEYRKRLSSAGVQIVLDFSKVRDYLDKGGLIVSTFKCPQCCGTLDLPNGGSFVKCGYCGSTVFAQDIFRRLKELGGG